jgi:hypothetical protein
MIVIQINLYQARKGGINMTIKLAFTKDNEVVILNDENIPKNVKPKFILYDAHYPKFAFDLIAIPKMFRISIGLDRKKDIIRNIITSLLKKKYYYLVDYTFSTEEKNFSNGYTFPFPVSEIKRTICDVDLKALNNISKNIEEREHGQG